MQSNYKHYIHPCSEIFETGEYFKKTGIKPTCDNDGISKNDNNKNNENRNDEKKQHLEEDEGFEVQYFYILNSKIRILIS